MLFLVILGVLVAVSHFQIKELLAFVASCVLLVAVET
jgi:hypothetical protein